jgi:hypothetical protein
MKQFEVFENPDRTNLDWVPYVVVVQHDRFSALPRVLVAPLLDGRLGNPDTELFPKLVVEGRACILDVSDMASIAWKHLATRSGTLVDQHDRIVRAVDMLVCGF